MGQREVKSCNYCYKRKVKCDKVFPCSRCVSRGLGDLCEQQTVIVNGRLTGGGKLPSQRAPTLAQLMEENKVLHRRINAQEKTIKSLLTKFESDQADLISQDHLDERSAHIEGERSRYTSAEPDINPEELGKNDYLSTVNQIYGIEPKRYNDAQQPAFTVNQTEAQTLNRLLCMVPVNFSAQLVRYHCQTLHWIHTVFHEPSFIREHDEWIASICLGTPLVKAYDFYALYFAVIACSLYFMDEAVAMNMGIPSDALAEWPRKWFNESIRYLQLSDFMVNPTIPILQTICILPMIAHAFDASKYLGALMHCALGLARDLDFHLATAGTNPEKYGGNIQIELVRRIWWCLSVTDSLRPEAHHPFHLCLPTARTSPPANINDSELVNGIPISSRPLTEVTRVTHLLAIGRLAALFRDFNQSFTTKTTLNARFKCVKDHDLRLQALLNDIPDLRPRDDEQYIPMSAVMQADANFDYRPWSRFIWSTSLPPSRIMLYRWFLGKSYTDERWSQARQVCLEAARATLAARKKPVPPLFQKNW
ncbi:uncharacterized protein IL334_005099 [Kwoniella shivajii]|uniref:Zn(2)-C6 fungal-type domain-containing protein n=1 Tax=Kwoniella shivajii TaxID=564305 RepID=A0ABZ1D272_9TREE|nr:hypothetical protein IL334_005099 [Kwoniella shivajii]